MGSSGRSISTWERTLLYFRGCFSGVTTTIFFTSKWPSSVREIMVEPSLLAFLPTRIVVQDIYIPSLRSVSLTNIPYRPPVFNRSLHGSRMQEKDCASLFPVV